MKKILIVEDDEILASTLTDNLTHEGFEVIRSLDGENGLLLALGEKPDLILLDLLLPKMGGMKMLEQLRLDDWGKNIPVIVLSNINESSEIEKAVGNGVYEYMLKVDTKIQDIMSKIKERLNV